MSLGVAARAADSPPTFAANCEPVITGRFAAFTLDVAGKVRASRSQQIPADQAIVVLATEHGTDVRLEVSDPLTKVVRSADSPLRRWGPQRVLLGAARTRAVEVAITGKERARGSVDIELFAVNGSSNENCLEAHRRLAIGDGHYAAAQRISLGEVNAPAGTARREYEAAVADYAEAAGRLSTAKPGKLRAQAEMSETAALYQGAQRYPDALDAGKRAEQSFVAIGDAYGIDRARAMRAAAQMEVALDPPTGSGTPEAIQRHTAQLLGEARDVFAQVAQSHARRGETFEQALATNNIGLSYYYEQRYDEALANYQKAAALHESLGETSRQAQALQNIALVQYELGRFSDARGSYQRALPLIDRNESQKLYADVLNNLALSEQKAGLPDAALRHYSDALDILTALQVAREQARSLHGIGATYYDIGNRGEALSYFTRALDIRKAEFDPYGRLASLRAIADVYRDTGDMPGAIARREEALALAPTAGTRMLLLIDLARDAAAGGSRDKAAKYFDEIFATDAGGDPVLYARALFERARFRFGARAFTAAAQDAREAHQLFGAQELAGSVFSSLVLESRIACARGELDAAMNAADQAIALSERLRRASSNPTMRAALWQPLRPAFDIRLGLFAQDRACGSSSRGDALAALDVAERARGRAMEDFRRIAASRGGRSSSPADSRRAELFESLATCRAQIESLSDSALENAVRLQALRNEAAGLSREIDILDGEIGAASRDPKNIRRERGSLPETIRPGVAVIEYWLGEEKSYAWLLTRGRVRMFDLGTTSRIDAAARAFHESLRDFSAVSTQERRRRGRELSALIVAPMASELARVRELNFVPDGSLHVVPFAALVVGSGSRESFLVEDHDIAIIPVVRTLREARPPDRSSANSRVLIVADPVYDRGDERFAPDIRASISRVAESGGITMRGGAGRGQGKSWPTLPGARREAASIAALFPASNVRMLSGFDANREHLLAEDLAGFRILHFASHAVADMQAPQLSALILSTFTTDGRPMSGEVFSGDILLRPLNADLVVFSACETALGREAAGEGLLGLRYAAHASGARSVVASLWPVADNVGEFLMRRMYVGVADKKDSAAALSAAMREARERWDDPAMWAVFQISTASVDSTRH